MFVIFADLLLKNKELCFTTARGMEGVRELSGLGIEGLWTPVLYVVFYFDMHKSNPPSLCFSAEFWFLLHHAFVLNYFFLELLKILF